MAEPLRLASGRDSRSPGRAARLSVGGRGLGTWSAEPPLTPPSCSMDGAGPRQAQEEGKPGVVHRESPTIAGQSLQLREKSLEEPGAHGRQQRGEAGLEEAVMHRGEGWARKEGSQPA